MSYWLQAQELRYLARTHGKATPVDTVTSTATGAAGLAHADIRRTWPVAVDTLPVSEVFGPTIQGEGLAAGRTVVFVRLMGCNLSCSWCDTPYTWDQTRFDLRAETTDLTAAAIAGRLADLAGPDRHPAVVISGGEPLRQQERPAFVHLLELIGRGRHSRRSLSEMTALRQPVRGLEWDIHIETNGTIAPLPYLLHHCAVVAVSPKLPHAGPHRGRQNPLLHPRWIDVLNDPDMPGVHLKVVVRTAQDVADVAALARETWRVEPERVWVMPEGTTAEALNYRWPEVVEAAVEHGLQATHRLHVLAWGDERGK